MLVFIQVYIAFSMFVIGTLFGSFFSLATYRLPRHQDIVATRSYCTSCKHRLSFFDLIPVLSYLIRGGKCKYCHEKISIRYFLLEVSNGLVFLMFYLLIGYNVYLLFVCIVYAVLFVLIGSSIMKKKMTKEEILEVEELVNKKKEEKIMKKISKKERNKVSNKIVKKRGIFVAELVVAMIIFTIFMATAFVITRNYNDKSRITIARSNAVALAVKNMEIARSTNYDSLNSFESNEEVDNIYYNVSVSVSKYSDVDFSKEDVVKTIKVKVDYMVDGKSYNYEIKTLKGKVI